MGFEPDTWYLKLETIKDVTAEKIEAQENAERENEG